MSVCDRIHFITSNMVVSIIGLVIVSFLIDLVFGLETFVSGVVNISAWFTSVVILPPFPLPSPACD